ncbi:MAG: hypothetical protein ACJAR1_001748 [Rubritalea sp.]|jgi:hypothetical protein
MKNKKSKNNSTDESEFCSSNEELPEVLPLTEDEAVKNPTNSGGEEIGAELVTIIAELDSASDLIQRGELYQNDVLVARLEHNKDDTLGKSFRSKDLSEVDLSEREVMPTLEDQWIQDESNSATVSWVKWFILLGILLAMSAGIWAFINLSGEEADRGEKAQEIKEIALVSVQSDIDDAQNIANVSACVKNYLEATSIEERAKYCRNQELTLRKMTKSYGNELIFDIYHFEGISKSSEIRMEDKEITIVSANISSQSGGTGVENKPKSLLLEKQEDGTYLVDWDTAVVYQPADWNAFIANRNTEAHVFRLEARERINYGPYLYEFSDDNIYQAYRIAIRGNAEKYLIGYTKKGSEVDEIMKSLTLVKGNKNTGSRMTVPMMLKLVFPKGAQSDQCVEILEVVSDSWFLP